MPATMAPHATKRSKSAVNNRRDPLSGRWRAKEQLFRGVIGKRGDEERQKTCPARGGQPGFAEGQINPRGDQKVQQKGSEHSDEKRKLQRPGRLGVARACAE